jgi:hypothetical protein
MIRIGEGRGIKITIMIKIKREPSSERPCVRDAHGICYDGVELSRRERHT